MATHFFNKLTEINKGFLFVISFIWMGNLDTTINDKPGLFGSFSNVEPTSTPGVIL